MACDLIVYAKRRCLGNKPQHLIYVYLLNGMLIEV